MKPTEQKIYGFNACFSFAKACPEQVIRAYCTPSLQKKLGFLLKYLAQQKRAYHIVSEAELCKLSGSEHHEGVLLLIARPALHSESEIFKQLASGNLKTPECLLCLDGVSNPHNLGSIARTAAHFGIHWIALFNLTNEQIKALVSGAYHRTAEGGAVHVQLCDIKQPLKFLERLKKDFSFTVAATSSHAKSSSLNDTALPERLALLMGSETEGVSPQLLEAAQLKVCINGTGHVESLNVASATAILLNEFSRQIQRRTDEPFSIKPTLVGFPEGRNRKGS
ncbi:tRNA/rRNA methyltransferase [bacterium]|nr:tRNA/rRNA methyltransferase [bacterium]